MAAKNGHEKSRLKIKSGLNNNNNSSSNYQDNLFSNIKNKKHIEVKRLLRRCKHINKRNKDGDTPLLASIKFSDYKTTKVILTCSPNQNIKDRFGKTALFLAAEKKQKKSQLN